MAKTIEETRAEIRTKLLDAKQSTFSDRVRPASITDAKLDELDQRCAAKKIDLETLLNWVPDLTAEIRRVRAIAFQSEADCMAPATCCIHVDDEG